MKTRKEEIKMAQVRKAIDNQKEKAEDEDDTIKKARSETVPFHKLLSEADALDWTLMALGTLGSIVHGLAQPVSYFLLGKALDAFGNNIDDTAAMVRALKKVCLKPSAMVEVEKRIFKVEV